MMKKVIIAAGAIALATSGAYAQRSKPVRGYFKPSTGTYVMPHQRTTPNSTKTDNWTSRPNVNPYTGKPGTVDPYAVNPYAPKPKRGW